MTHFQYVILLVSCKSTLILGILVLLNHLSGRRRRFASTTWKRVGIVALLVLPIAVWAFPTVGIPVLPITEPTAATANDGTTYRETFRPVPIPRNEFEFSKALPVPKSNPLAAVSEVRSLPSPKTNDSRIPSKRFSMIVGIAFLYILVASLLLIRLIGSAFGLGRLKSSSSPIRNVEWLMQLRHWSKELRVRRPVDLRVTDDVSIPMTFGWRSPVILIPRHVLIACDQYQREAILVHELTHISQGDFFWQILIQLAAAIYWIHPLIWVVRREAQQLRERLCDLLCTEHLGHGTYTKALIQVASHSVHRPQFGLGMAMAEHTLLKRRLDDLERYCGSQDARSGRANQSLICGVAFIALGLVVVSVLTARVPTRAAAVASQSTVPVINNVICPPDQAELPPDRQVCLMDSTGSIWFTRYRLQTLPMFRANPQRRSRKCGITKRFTTKHFLNL